MKEIKYPGLVWEMVRHGETQKYLGELIGVSYASLSRRLSGISEFSINEIEKICEHYGKTYEELIKKGE